MVLQGHGLHSTGYWLLDSDAAAFSSFWNSSVLEICDKGCQGRWWSRHAWEVFKRHVDVVLRDVV